MSTRGWPSWARSSASRWAGWSTRTSSGGTACWARLARGDITIAMMVGAGAGACTLSALVYGVLASGLFAVGVLVARRSRHSFLPYGPGLCLGGLITLFRC